MSIVTSAADCCVPERAPRRLTRRAFVHAAGRTAGGLLGALVVAACAHDAHSDRAELGSPALLPVLGPDRVRAIGDAWRRQHPAERDAASLAAAIARHVPRRARTAAAVETALATAVVADFEAGRTVVVDGWLLAVTEVRQCALFTLLAG